MASSSSSSNKTLLTDETDKNVLEKCVLVTHLRLNTGPTHIEEHFQKFGTVVNVCFLYRTLKVKKACIVEMQSPSEVEKILNQREHEVRGLKCHVGKYHGKGTYEDVLENGKYVVVLYGLEAQVKQRKWSVNDICEMLETLFGENYCVDMDVSWKDPDHTPTGEVLVTFASPEDRENSLDNLCEDERLAGVSFQKYEKDGLEI